MQKQLYPPKPNAFTYLEERIEHAEKQQETTARAVADLTVDVHAIRHNQNEGFKRMDTRFNRLETRVEKLETDVSVIKETLQMVLACLHKKLP